MARNNATARPKGKQGAKPEPGTTPYNDSKTEKATARKRRPKRKPAAKDGITTDSSGLIIQNADIERAEPFEWAWDQRVLMGYINLLIGEEGIGKGHLIAWMAARITRGELPGDLRGKPRLVAFIGDEDSWDRIWTPRLIAAGADLSFVKNIKAGKHGAIDVKGDADSILSYVKRENVALVYFDQLLDNLGHADSWKDKEVRDKLAPIRAVAQETGCAVLASMHPNKRQGSFRDRISGTPAFNALSRSSLLVAPHPDEPGRAAVVRGKGNYSVEPDAFEFRIEGQEVKNKRHVMKTSRITSVRETSLRRDDLLDGTSRRQGDSQAGRARTFLAEMFSGVGALPAADVLKQMRGEGFDERVIQSARQTIGLESWKVGFQGPNYWGYRKPGESGETGEAPQ
jgi:hypothetical protein